MMLAWAMNGEALEPDHGFPLRLVVPGQIGGKPVLLVFLFRLDYTHHETYYL